MVTPAAVDQLFAAWLADQAGRTPTDGELAAFVAALPLPAQRRAARQYAIGFVRGCDYCTTQEHAQARADLGIVEDRLAVVLAVVRALRGPPPGSPP